MCQKLQQQKQIKQKIKSMFFYAHFYSSRIFYYTFHMNTMNTLASMGTYSIEQTDTETQKHAKIHYDNIQRKQIQ